MNNPDSRYPKANQLAYWGLHPIALPALGPFDKCCFYRYVEVTRTMTLDSNEELLDTIAG
ncbi:hypothetical protein [Microbulbifer sp. A4B17]|uniref:hypothetical protein n=1 Tax=Microbulbifer sp. A4B17 TaxID=359370 RepID=UPI001300B611|nr:hypothetical protein [Microbulbifer sp. A4B17]